jgi:CBS domain containing-hemolysin-like protein
MTALSIAIILTLGVSAFCSLLEAFILSVSMAEIEALKQDHPGPGRLLERFKAEIDETSSAILTLNTIANTAGATIVGALAAGVFASAAVGWVSGGMVFAILIFSEIIPKNLGIAYRRGLRLWLVWPLAAVRLLMKPISLLARSLLQILLKQQPPSEKEQEDEIRLLAERSAQSGVLSDNERDLIANTLSLDDVAVESVSFLRSSLTVDEVCRDWQSIPFARMPVYEENLDDITGIVRRRDILQAQNEGKGELTMDQLKHTALFVPENASGLQALQLFVRTHRQIGVVVDEYGSTAGVITMEDIFEHLLGEEIYEDSDLAVDMRELARTRAEKAPPPTPDLAPAAPAASTGKAADAI